VAHTYFNRSVVDVFQLRNVLGMLALEAPVCGRYNHMQGIAPAETDQAASSTRGPACVRACVRARAVLRVAGVPRPHLPVRVVDGSVEVGGAENGAEQAEVDRSSAACARLRDSTADTDWSRTRSALRSDEIAILSS